MEITYKNLEDLNPFEGNPRKRSEKVLNHLVKSIIEFGFVEPILIWKNAEQYGYPRNCILGGHRRLDALNYLIETDGMEVVPIPCVEVDIAGIEKAKALNIALNKIGEEFDYPMLKDFLIDIDVGEIDVEVTGFDEVEIKDIFDYESEPDNYTRKIESPVYEPKNEKPAISNLYDDNKTNELITEIQNANLPDDITLFLMKAAERHTVFNFARIADFYAHSDNDIQNLMERSALVIIDFDKAIENGFVRLTKWLGKLAENSPRNENE